MSGGHLRTKLTFVTVGWSVPHVCITRWIVVDDKTRIATVTALGDMDSLFGISVLIGNGMAQLACKDGGILFDALRE